MKLSITSAVKEVLRKRFEEMLSLPEYKHVGFHVDNHFRSYKMMEYSIEWSKFVKLVDTCMKEIMMDGLGVFSRQRNKRFLSNLESLVSSIKPDEAIKVTERFKTMWD